MAESPTDYVTPEGTRVNITYQGTSSLGVVASDLVVTADFSEPAGRAMLGSCATDRDMRALQSIISGESVPNWEASELEIDRAARAALDYAEPTGEASWGGWFGEKRKDVQQ